MNNMTKEQKEQDYGGDAEFYTDSNLFIYSALDKGLIGSEAKIIIKKINDGEYNAYTSTLTIDEVLWKVQKDVGRGIASETAKKMINLKNLKFIDADIFVIQKAVEIYQTEKIDPRDSIHLASMKKLKLNLIISSDSDFDKIKEIKRIDFTKVKHIQGYENGNKK